MSSNFLRWFRFAVISQQQKITLWYFTGFWSNGDWFGWRRTSSEPDHPLNHPLNSPFLKNHNSQTMIDIIKNSIGPTFRPFEVSLKKIPIVSSTFNIFFWLKVCVHMSFCIMRVIFFLHRQCRHHNPPHTFENFMFLYASTYLRLSGVTYSFEKACMVQILWALQGPPAWRVVPSRSAGGI